MSPKADEQTPNGHARESLWERIKHEITKPRLVFAASSDADLEDLKVILTSSDLRGALQQVREARRDQVVMVRLDEETQKQLDDWVEVGAVKSRSEAAALFIREGLSTRRDEIEELRGALRDVERAKERLRRKADEIFEGASADED